MSGSSKLNDEIRALHAAGEDERASDPLAARKKAMDLLARREHAAGELERKLSKNGFNADTAADAIAELRREGLQSDERFVESFVQSRVNQGKGPVRIRAELGQRGIAEAITGRILDAAGVDWYALARTTRLQKFGEGVPADYKEKARQMRFLQYRGFEPDQIASAVER
ncbi:MAG: regulatory protein RecX [Pseudomonadota bacterium]